MRRHRALHLTMRVAVCLGAILAAGCGGGGDDAPPPPELLQISAGNQVAVARATAINFASLDSVRDLPVASSSGAAQASAVAGLTKHALGKAVATARAAARVEPLAVISSTENCAVSGSIAVTLDDRDNNETPSSGDLLTVAFNDCRDSASSMIKGSVALNIASYSAQALGGVLTFGQLTLADEDGLVAMNGQASFEYTTSLEPSLTATTRVTLTVAAAGLVAKISIPGYSESLTHDPGFSAVWTDVAPLAQPGYSTATLSGKVHVASLGGKMILATDPPVHNWSAEDFPDSGRVLITGDQSRLQLTVLNTTTARLELDANNDGAFESTRDIPWTELLPF